MCSKPLSNEEIIFGTVFNDGHFSSLLHYTPTAEQLKLLWEKYDNFFAHNSCEECGHKSYAFADKLKEDPGNPGHVGYHEMVFFCPHCGTRKGYGGNFFRSQAILGAIKQEYGMSSEGTTPEKKDSDDKKDCTPVP